MRLERLALQHLDAVVALENRDGDVHWTRSHFEKELHLPVSRFSVFAEHGAVLAYGGYWKIFDEAQLMNLVVAQDKRRQGLATLLVNHFCSNARLEGCTVMTLEVRKANLAAVHLYKRLNFQEFGLRRNFYENPVDDAVLMNKSL